MKTSKYESESEEFILNNIRLLSDEKLEISKEIYSLQSRISELSNLLSSKNKEIEEEKAKLNKSYLNQIGVIGIGNIGSAVVEGLLKGGYEVFIYDKYNERLKNSDLKGLTWVNSPTELAARVNILITCLPAPLDVLAVMEEGGVLKSMRPGTIWIAHESTLPDEAERFGILSNELGIRMLEAPLTGGIELIRQFKMTVTTSGPKELSIELKHLLGCYTVCHLHVGNYGSASTIKIISNMLCAVHTVVTGEALMLAKRAGIEHRTFFESIRLSAGNSFVFETEAPLAFKGTFDPHFTLKLHCKDLAIGDKIARKFNVPIEVFGLVEQIYNRARIRYGEHMGSSHPMKLLQDDLKTSLQEEGWENWTYSIIEIEDKEGICVVHRNIQGRPSTNNTRLLMKN